MNTIEVLPLHTLPEVFSTWDLQNFDSEKAAVDRAAKKIRSSLFGSKKPNKQAGQKAKYYHYKMV
jgi:hypothetical protein